MEDFNSLKQLISFTHVLPTANNPEVDEITCQNILRFWAEKWTSADVMTFFFLVFTCFWAEKWTSADMMTLTEPVILLCSENMVTLTITDRASGTSVECQNAFQDEGEQQQCLKCGSKITRLAISKKLHFCV